MNSLSYIPAAPGFYVLHGAVGDDPEITVLQYPIIAWKIEPESTRPIPITTEGEYPLNDDDDAILYINNHSFHCKIRKSLGATPTEK